jgi:hypothetical protein
MTVKLMDCLSEETLVLEMVKMLDSTSCIREHIEKLVAPAPEAMAANYRESNFKSVEYIDTYEEFFQLMGVAEDFYLSDSVEDKDCATLLLKMIPCTDEWMQRYAEENPSSPFVKVH